MQLHAFWSVLANRWSIRSLSEHRMFREPPHISHEIRHSSLRVSRSCIVFFSENSATEAAAVIQTAFRACSLFRNNKSAAAQTTAHERRRTHTFHSNSFNVQCSMCPINISHDLYVPHVSCSTSVGQKWFQSTLYARSVRMRFFGAMLPIYCEIFDIV